MLSSQNITDVIKLVKNAGNEILKIYSANDFHVTIKSDQSPVTAADIASDKLIKRGLSEITPTIPVFSEETKEVSFEKRASWNPLWILDPLDGTKEFIALNGEFCICLALVKDYKPVAGFIYAPVTNEFWYALEGKGAFKLEKDKKMKLPLKSSEGPIIITISRSHHNKNEEDWIKKLLKRHESSISIQGSAIKFCRIAEGHADIYPKFGPINEWDVAAGDIIVKESGGEMVEVLTGLAPVYNKKDFIQPHFIVSGQRLKGIQL